MASCSLQVFCLFDNIRGDDNNRVTGEPHRKLEDSLEQDVWGRSGSSLDRPEALPTGWGRAQDRGPSLAQDRVPHRPTLTLWTSPALRPRAFTVSPERDRFHKLLHILRLGLLRSSFSSSYELLSLKLLRSQPPSFSLARFAQSQRALPGREEGSFSFHHSQNMEFYSSFRRIFQR